MQKADFIGQKYEVHRELGKGGFGVVYLAYSHEAEMLMALKTFRDEYLLDKAAREQFKHEARIWIDLDRHPFLVQAYYIEEFNERLFIAIEYVAPNERGLNTLAGYIRNSPPDLKQTTKWAIEFCHGMEHAYFKGLRCHRDIKPANILVDRDGSLKISDFGLAGVLARKSSEPMQALVPHQFGAGLSMYTLGNNAGTPTHMSPEHFASSADCDERSDIYSFGVVLFEMAAGGKLPFFAHPPKDASSSEMARFWREMGNLHSSAPIPQMDSPLAPVIHRCLRKNPVERYASFAELRNDLESFHLRNAGERLVLLDTGDKMTGAAWANKALSLGRLGRHTEAINCIERALQLEPRRAMAWNIKAICLKNIGQHEESLRCSDKALSLDSANTVFWQNKGWTLHELGRLSEAIQCFDRALAIDPKNEAALSNKGLSLMWAGQLEQALLCFNRAVEIDPQRHQSWYNKGLALYHLGEYEAAIRCFDQSLQLNPNDAEAWNDKGVSLLHLGSAEEALNSYDHAIEIDPAYAKSWYNKGNALLQLGRLDEALTCYDRGVELAPNDSTAFMNKGNCLATMERFTEAVAYYERAASLNPDDFRIFYNMGLSWRGLGEFRKANKCFGDAIVADSSRPEVWLAKAVADDRLGEIEDAVFAYSKFIEIAPPADAEKVEAVRARLKALGYRCLL